MEKKNYYFFKLVLVKGELKVYPIEGQTMIDGSKIDTSLAVTCPKKLREGHDEGTYFVAKDIYKSKTGKYYCVSGFRIFDKRSKEEVEEINKYLKEEEKFVYTEDSLFNIISSDPSLKTPTSSEDGFFMKDEDWSLLLRNIKKHVNTLILGPTGTGKTSCVKEACDRLGIKLYIFDMGSMIDPISSLLGVHRLEDGHSIFDFAKFTKVIKEPCVILLDELNRSSISSNNVLFPCLDDRRELNVEVAGSKDIRSIKVHPEVTFIATANIGSEYTGTIGMDKALVNRFFPLELGYIPSAEESKVLIKRYGITKEKSDLIVKVANNIRSMFNKSEVSNSVSIRETLMISELVSDGWDLASAMERVFLPLFEGTKTEGERMLIYKTILSY